MNGGAGLGTQAVELRSHASRPTFRVLELLFYLRGSLNYKHLSLKNGARPRRTMIAQPGMNSEEGSLGRGLGGEKSGISFITWGDQGSKVLREGLSLGFLCVCVCVCVCVWSVMSDSS